MPRYLLSTTTILIGSPNRFTVASSWIFIWKPPSPEIETTFLFGLPNCTPMAAGKAKPIAPKPPEVMKDRGELER